MNARRFAIVAAFAGASIVAFASACGSDEEAVNVTVALTIEGQGSVTSEPAGFDCKGPTDCGTHTFAATSVVLTPAPAAGYALVKETVDDVAVANIQSTLKVDAGSTRRVVITFEPVGTSPPPDGGPPPNDAATGDSSSQPDTATSPLSCNGAMCGATEKCCLADVSDGGGPAFAYQCAASCGPDDFEAPCFTIGDCTAGNVCCLRATNSPTPGKLSCEPEAACKGLGAPLCDDQHPCRTDAGFECTDIDPISICLEQK